MQMWYIIFFYLAQMILYMLYMDFIFTTNYELTNYIYYEYVVAD